MSQSSDTQCDSGSEAPECYGKGVIPRPVEFSKTPSPSGDLFKPTEAVLRDAVLAANQLYAIRDSLGKLLQDESAAEELEACFTDILLFVEAEAGGLLSVHENQDLTGCTIAIFDAEFLRILLDIRKQLLHVSLNEEPHHSGDMLACWVDKLFAACWECISHIAGCRWKLVGQKDSPLPSLLNYKKEDNLRAACQLPKTWRQFPELLRSGHASPAAKRLALCILFAAFVIRSDLEDCDPWAETDINPECVVECLQPLVEGFAKQARDLAVSENTPSVRHLRTAFAMTIALYSSAETAHRLRSSHHLTSFQPQTLACMLELMHAIFPLTSQLPTTALAPDYLDDAQLILLHWGASISWIWDKWNDPRIIGFDVVIAVTANWLCHLDKSLPLVLWNENCAQAERTESGLEHALRTVVSLNPCSSLTALAHQIRDQGSRVTDSASSLRLHRTTWCIAELFENWSDQLAPGDLTLVTEQLVVFFAELEEIKEETHTKVKVEIIRCLNALEPKTIEKVLLSFNKNISFFTKVANAIEKVSRMIMGDAIGNFLLAPGVPNGLVALLDFLTLFLKHNATKCLPATSFALLADLVKFLSRRFGTPTLRISLLNCLSFAHGQRQMNRSAGQAEMIEINVGVGAGSPASKSSKTWNDEGAYNLALDTVGTDLDLAAAFASYVSLTIKKNMDPLLVVETWDYLRDVLILLTSGHLEECGVLTPDEDSISSQPRTSPKLPKGNRALKVLSATEKICTALGALLDRSDIVVVRLMLNLPMTISLYTSLESLVYSAQTGRFNGNDVGNDNAGESRPSAADNARQLDPQLVQVCERLLEKLRKTDGDLNKVL